jgi:hypothetical protein
MVHFRLAAVACAICKQWVDAPPKGREVYVRRSRAYCQWLLLPKATIRAATPLIGASTQRLRMTKLDAYPHCQCPECHYCAMAKRLRAWLCHSSSMSAVPKKAKVSIISAIILKMCPGELVLESFDVRSAFYSTCRAVCLLAPAGSHPPRSHPPLLEAAAGPPFFNTPHVSPYCAISLLHSVVRSASCDPVSLHCLSLHSTSRTCPLTLTWGPLGWTIISGGTTHDRSRPTIAPTPDALDVSPHLD